MSESIFARINAISEKKREDPTDCWETFKERRSRDIQEELDLAKHIKRGRKRQLDIYTYFLENKLKDS